MYKPDNIEGTLYKEQLQTMPKHKVTWMEENIFISDMWKPEVIELEKFKSWRVYAVFEASFTYPNLKLLPKYFYSK